MLCPNRLRRDMISSLGIPDYSHRPAITIGLNFRGGLLHKANITRIFDTILFAKPNNENFSLPEN